jgi:hypothetical protein
MATQSQIEEFETMLDRFTNLGYEVNQVSECGAIIYNNGVEDNYSSFDNTVATISSEQNDFGFRPPSNMKELYEKTVVNGDPTAEYEIYFGVFIDTEDAIKGYGYTFV